MGNMNVHYSQLQSSVSHQSEPSGSHMWQVQQSRGRRRIQTYPGIPESQVSNEFLDSPFSVLLNMPESGAHHQHQHVSRVESDPMASVIGAAQHQAEVSTCA